MTTPNGKAFIMDADTVYLCLKENIPISRASRVQWLLNKLNTVVTFPAEGENAWLDDGEFKLLSVIPTDQCQERNKLNSSHDYLITTNTKLKFLADCYRIVYCLDISPSQSSVDIQYGEILFNEIFTYFKRSIEELARSFMVPGSSFVVQPKIYLTVIAHTPFFMTPAQQVLIKGIQVTLSNVEHICSVVEKQLKILEERIAAVSKMAHCKSDEQKVHNEKIIGSLFEENQMYIEPVPNIPVVSPDVNFVNMLRYSMLALSLLPENCLSNIVIITDGVVALPDVVIMESLLSQLHYDGTSVSFIKVGSLYHPHVCAGYVPYSDILRFLSNSTMGTYLEALPLSEASTQVDISLMNMFHKAYLVWTFHSNFDEDVKSTVDTGPWNSTSKYLYSQKMPTLLRKKQVEDKVNTSLLLLLSRRVRSGFTIDRIQYNNNLLQIELSLPWKSFIYLRYTMSMSWPLPQTVVQYTVYVDAPYEFLHDITCSAKKELKSNLRQAVVEKFWNFLTHLKSGDISLVQYTYPFQNSNVWYTLPESVKNRMSTFIATNNTSTDATKPQFTAGDSKFGAVWQPICQLENSQWNKWFHTHKISLIVRHDDPLPTNLHLPNSSGRYEIVQCRQSTSALNTKLSDWSSFILIENHSYVKFLNNNLEKPVWYCIIRVTSKCPCIVINLGFMTGTPGHIRQKVCEELKDELIHLYLTSLRNQESNACTLLNKPLEKILIRYERMPNDFNTVVFPDGTQPPNPYHLWLPPPVVGALFTTLSRYLYHKRWIWYTSCIKTAKPCVTAVAQILSTLTKIRLKEGFSFAHSASGIINMVLEIEMGSKSNNNVTDSSLSCVIQYVIFPPHCRNYVDVREQGSGSEDEAEKEHELESELQIVTEVWIEPQYGFVVSSPDVRAYMESQQYYQLADKIGYVDSECISSLLTLEHLNMMCKTKLMKLNEDNKCISALKHLEHSQKRKTSIVQNPIIPDLILTHDDFKYTSTNSFKCSDSGFHNKSTSLMDERIHTIPFNFNLNNILPISQQTELLFSMFIEDKNCAKLQNEYDMSNKLLMNSLHTELLLLHDRELYLYPEDSLYFFGMLSKKHKEQSVHKCPFASSYYYLGSDQTVPIEFLPQWRCFMKSVSLTHVIMTFVPASLTDLKKILNPLEVNSENQEDESSKLILPVYVYDCSSTALINSYTNTENKVSDKNVIDVYEDQTYETNDSCDEEIYLQAKRKLMLPIIEHKNEDLDADEKSAAKQHCRTIISTHSKCFVMSLFKSLRSRISLHRTDVKAALRQCDVVVDEIDITEYLKVICGHLKFIQDSNIIIDTLNQLSACDDLKPLHKLIKEKFLKIIRNSFQPTPSSPDFYFFLPVLTDRTIISDDIGDDEISSIPSETILKSDEHSLVSSEEIDATNFVNSSTNIMTEFPELYDDVKPLFLQLNCSVNIDNNIHHMALNDLPTCLGDILQNITYEDQSLDLSKFQLTLNIICLTLPPDVHVEGTEPVKRSTRKISYCSLNPFPLNNTQLKTESTNLEENFVESQNIFNHLPKFQQKTIRALKEEIKWFLRDEMSTSLLDLEPVTSATLNMVINHIESNSSKFSCKKDVINLNFVYGASHSSEKFLREFRELPIYVENNIRYKLCEENDLYYLAKFPRLNNINEQENKSNTKNTFSHSSIVPETSSLNESEIILNAENNDIQSDNCSNIVSVKNNESINIDDEDFAWLNNIERKRLILPNFWLILRIDQETVTIYFHCRFLDLQTSKVNNFLNVQKAVILTIKNLCKKVNQSMLLQYLYDTKICDRLLEPEDEETDMWHSSNTTPSLTRNASFVRAKSVENEPLADIVKIPEVAYFEASLKFIPGYFRCNSVWQTHFSLHPRLKTGPGKTGLSRSIQALRTVLNKFAVSNRNNMFVYQDKLSNVFYLRLHENVQSNSNLHLFRSQNGSNVVRSPSISSLMKGSNKKYLNVDQELEIRPRVRSIGEQDTPIGDAIILKVHGITDAGSDVKTDLVEVLQNRLDDAVLEILSVMLARNALCPLTPEDVHFIQKPFRLPEIIKLFIPEHALNYLDSFLYYLRQNLLQFLNVPKYTDSNSYNHFKDYSEKEQKLSSKEDLIFLYNQSQNPSAGSRGLACIILTLINNNRFTQDNTMPRDCNYMKLFQDRTFENITADIIPSDKGDEATVHLEFRIWKRGRLNLDTLKTKLKSAVCQSVWDLVSEYHLFRAPLCYKKNKSKLSGENELLISFIYSGFSLCVDASATTEHFRKKRLKSYVPYKLKKLMPPSSDLIQKLSKPLVANVETSFSMNETKMKSTSSSLISLEIVNPNVVRISTENPVKSTENKLNVSLNAFEKGEKGLLHEVYSDILVKWFEYAIELNVPSVKKCEIPLVNRHSIKICVRELQHIVKSLVPNTSVKAFNLLHYNYRDNCNKLKCSELYVPYHKAVSMPVKCILIGRNLEQWKTNTFTDSSFDYVSWIDASLLKHYQKFIPSVIMPEVKFVPRQRLFLAIVISNSMTLYTYNWSKERVDKLIIQSINLGMWLDARASMLSSIIAQKRGLFHNQTTFRKSTQATNNPYLCHVGESSDHLYKFPSSSLSVTKDSTSRKTTKTIQGTVLDVFRDFRPLFYDISPKYDTVVTYSVEMLDMKQRLKNCLDEKKQMHNVWQSRGATSNLLQTNMLKRHARTIHYCHTPLLFLQTWRLMSAATRDYTLSTDMFDENVYDTNISDTDDVTWHDELCSEFIREYKQYLQILGFVILEVAQNRNNNKEYIDSAVCYVQKPMLGGIMIFAIELKEPFFTVKLYAIECCRLQQKVSRNLYNQFTLSFLDECDRIKSLMHLHSFTYDFHLRCIHSYVANNPGVKLCTDYHLTRFLDDFYKYYPKTPNFARNVFSSEIITIKDLVTEGQQLYTYLLSNIVQYNLNVLSMKRSDFLNLYDRDYVLVQVSNTPQVTYKDSQDRQQTDDFNFTLIISNLGKSWQHNEHVLRFKFFIIVTSHREIYPKCDVEKTLGKFRTVSSVGINFFSSQLIENDSIDHQDFINKISDSTIEKSSESTKLNKIVIDEENSLEISTGEEINKQQYNEELPETTKRKISLSGNPHHVEIKQESVNYLGYYSSHEQLMQQLLMRQTAIARQQIKQMVTQGVVHCRTHLLWTKLVSHEESNFLTYEEFSELRELSKLENLIDFYPDLKILLNHPFAWYQTLVKLLMNKYVEQNRIFLSPDGNIQHLVVLHPKFVDTFMMVTTDVHTQRGDLYAVSKELPQTHVSDKMSVFRTELINGFINCVAAHIWSGMVQ